MSAHHFALVPAAGLSARMGSPKLLLALAGQPLVLHTIGAWQRSRVDRIIVVVRPGDDVLAEVVREAFKSTQATVHLVIPDMPPPDMKTSLQAALQHIERRYAPASNDAFLVAPADMPQLSTPIIDRLITRRTADTAKILVPTLEGRRGHPVLFPWPLAAEVFGLEPNQGLNSIVERYQPLLVPCDDLVAPREAPFADVDTPEEFRHIADG